MKLCPQVTADFASENSSSDECEDEENKRVVAVRQEKHIREKVGGDEVS